MKEQADVILIDEAHHFRNRGLRQRGGWHHSFPVLAAL